MASSLLVSREGLSKREISWLLAQEARAAAQALRQGLAVQSNEATPPLAASPGAVDRPSSPMLDGLAALDDAMSLLGELQSHRGVRHRGRIDVAALLCELSPDAKIAIETSEGSEVFGDEEHVTRMLQLLLTQSSGQVSHAVGPLVRIHREGDFVHISTELGPDAANNSSLERRWLERMALRAGGRQIVTGGTHTLVLPADGALQEREIEDLKRELSEAQQLGEAYARELANVLYAAEKEAAAHSGSEHAHGMWQGALLVARACGEREKAPEARPLHEVILCPLSDAAIDWPSRQQHPVDLQHLERFARGVLETLAGPKALTFQIEAFDATEAPSSCAQASSECALTWILAEASEQAREGSTLRVEIRSTASELSLSVGFGPTAAGDAPPPKDGLAATLLRCYLAARGGQFGRFREGNDIVRLSARLPRR